MNNPSALKSGTPFVVHHYGFKHTTSSPYYPQKNGFTELNICTIKSTIYKATVSKMPMSQALMNLCQTSISPSLPSPQEILHNCLAGPYSTCQQTPALMHLQRICEVLIHCNHQQKKAYDSRKNAKVLKHLHTGQGILYITTQSRWLHVTIAKVAWDPEVMLSPHLLAQPTVQSMTA